MVASTSSNTFVNISKKIGVCDRSILADSAEVNLCRAERDRSGDVVIGVKRGRVERFVLGHVFAFELYSSARSV